MKETSIAITVAGCSSNSNNNNNNSGCSSSSAANSGPKMGSRRIFTPQFKLQVLESYRNDSDCKGNQRATARKYNIHRRQIQKWLQCESNLRSSVANINQNNVKHQFHNISHHHHHHPQQQQQQPTQVSNSATDVSGSHYSHHHHSHHHQQRQHLSLDPTRHSVALSSLTVPSPRSGDGGTSSTTSSTQGVLAAANLAAVVAAAAAAGAAGAMAMASAPTSTTKVAAATTTNVVSPLRPTAIVGSSGRTMSPPSILHPHLAPHHHHQHQHQHHHHYSMPYTHTPAVPVPVPVSVPILTHHITPHQPLHHYQYHNLSHHPHSTVAATATALTQAQPQPQPSAFLPSSVSLPVPILSSAATKAANAPISGNNAIVHCGEKIRNIDELRDVTATTATATATATATGNSYMLRSDGYENGGESCQEYIYKNYKKKYENMQQQQQTLSVAPIDLSLGPRRSCKEEIQQYAEEAKGVVISQSNIKQNTPIVVTNDGTVVDLTFRKRKVVVTSAHVSDEQPEKLSKLIVDSSDTAIKLEVEDYDTAVEEHEEDEEVDVDVEERTPPSKPIKLFKPYLLDDDDEDQNLHKKTTTGALYENGVVEQRDPIIWSHHPACMSPNSYDSRQGSSRGSNFQTPPLEKYNTFPVGSPYFPNSTIIPSAATSTLGSSSPTSTLRCPKGSPVSGYESSSSTYSDSSCKAKQRAPTSNGSSRAFSIDLKLHPIYNDNMILNESHIQKWLDQDTVTTNQPTANTSIALCV